MTKRTQVWTRALLVVLGGSATPAMVAADEVSRSSELHRHILAFADEALGTSGSSPDFRERLRQFEATLVALQPDERLALERKLLTVRLMAEEGLSWPARAAALNRRKLVPVVTGSGCGSPLSAEDVTTELRVGQELWLRTTADSRTGWIAVSTAGSSFDTTIEVWSGCPESGGERLATADDELGLQAQLTLRRTPAEALWVRLAGWGQDHGTLIASLGGPSSGIAGRVLREGTQTGLEQRIVRAWSTGGVFAGGVATDSSGAFAFGSLAPGAYFVSTFPYPTWETGLLDELYDDVPCPGGMPNGCDPDLATPVLVVDGEMTTDIDFELGPGGRIAGRVVEAGTNHPLGGLVLSAYNPNGGLVARATTDGAGRYVVAGLAGATWLVVEGASSHRSEVWDDVPCGLFCDPTVGALISAEAGSTVVDIDFALDRLGAISGKVVRAADGTALPGVQVLLQRALGTAAPDGQASTPGTGAAVGLTTTNSLGEYEVGGLDPGNYYVATRNYAGYQDEVWQDHPCPAVCNLSVGEPVAVELAGTTSGIDFGLDRLGSISGAVIDALTGEAVDSGSVYVLNAAGVVVRTGSVHDGSYLIEQLQSEAHKVLFVGWLHRGMLFDGIDCPSAPSGCPLELGADVVVAAEAVTSGIDFEVVPLGGLSGTVVPSAGSDPIVGYELAVWNLAGGLAYVGGGATPSWELAGIAPGEYHVTVTHPDYADELYDNLPCPGGTPADCDPGGLASAVTVASGATTPGIDFELELMGSVAGVLTRASDGAEVSGQVEVFDLAGNLVSTGHTWGGAYRVGGLPTGDYHVKASSNELSSRLFDDVPCPHLCDVTAGTVVSVVAGATASGIDIALPAQGHITGFVAAAAGPPPTQGLLLVVSGSDGNPHRFSWLGAGGEYQIAVEEGTHYVAVLPEVDFVEQVYDGINCPSGCSPTSGTPVVVLPALATTGIDFELEPLTGIVGVVTDSGGRPLSGVAVDVWLPNGAWTTSAVTGSNGRYRIPATTGIFYLSTDNGFGAIDRVWAEVECPLGPAYLGLCDPLEGDSVSPQGGLAQGIDFLLTRVPLFHDGFESGDTSAWSQ